MVENEDSVSLDGRKYYIETYGCQMNEHDSEKMALILESQGLLPASAPEDADVMIINTCSVREKAEQKLYSALGKLKALKSRNRGLITVVAGCVAQQEKEKLLKKVGHLDVVVGTHNIHQLPRLILEAGGHKKRVVRVEWLDDPPSLHIKAPMKGRSPIISYVTIMQGCSNFCSYCVVPFTRGPEQSRDLNEIREEVEDLVRRGTLEVTLLGQNVNAYGTKNPSSGDFTELLSRLNDIEGLSRIRFTTSHPRDFSENLAAALARLDKVCEHIHLPLQSGSDKILSAMRRGYTLAEYMGKVDLLRALVPKAAITADMIVGFPGETDEDFHKTLEALQRIRFDQIFSFKFSPRPGTPAGHLPDQVPENVKVERLAMVHELQDKITEDYHSSSVGKLEEILIEGIRLPAGQPFGRTRTNKIVNLISFGNIRIGETIKVRIVEGLKHSLRGETV
jgi:tRNA-2-methylthio-N6-dimethylallyladenosine synthase